MSAVRLGQLLPILWPSGEGHGGENVYAILDGARDPRIEPMVRLSQRQYRCLYSGTLAPALAAAAPYAVFLARNSLFTQELLELMWGNSWGVFAAAPPDCTLDDIRRHFRKFLKVHDEEARTMIFRFYDPRVLRVYLGASGRFESETFFGPVTRLVMEDRDGQPLTMTVRTGARTGAPTG